jgi:DNA repair protein RecN (Recombination protein N)
MLLELEIKNFILIEHHKISFDKGFSSLTGETGAGKSIILDALNLLKGARTESKYQKNKELKTEIFASFDINNNNKINDLLIIKDLIDEENPNILSLRRVILPNGKSNSYINNTKSSLQDLKSIGELLIEIHSQNSSRNLMNVDKQQDILDIYCDNHKNISSLVLLCKEYNALKKDIKKYKDLKEEHKNKVELIQYKISELEEINILEGEYESLTKEFEKLSNSGKIDDLCSDSKSLVDNITSSFYKVKGNIEELIENNNVKSMKQMVDEVVVNLEEISSGLKEEQNNIVTDDFRMNDVENRISKINILSRKHFIDPENFESFYLELKAELDDFDEYDQKIEELELKQNEVEKEWNKEALIISKIRKKEALNFSEEITKKIKTLKMKNAEFKIVFEENENVNVNKNGIDKISFQISTNLGSEFEALKQAASGGEISRIALAVQAIISKNYNIPTQIFDEIDVGIGGTTGNSIGLFLHEISKYSQVLSITHLPQVASFADCNFYIYKKEFDSKTVTYIEQLENEDKLKEFSRMLGYEIFSEENKQMVLTLIENSEEMKKNEIV